MRDNRLGRHAGAIAGVLLGLFLFVTTWTAAKPAPPPSVVTLSAAQTVEHQIRRTAAASVTCNSLTEQNCVVHLLQRLPHSERKEIIKAIGNGTALSKVLSGKQSADAPKTGKAKHPNQVAKAGEEGGVVPTVTPAPAASPQPTSSADPAPTATTPPSTSEGGPASDPTPTATPGSPGTGPEPTPGPTQDPTPEPTPTPVETASPEPTATGVSPSDPGLDVPPDVLVPPPSPEAAPCVVDPLNPCE